MGLRRAVMAWTLRAGCELETDEWDGGYLLPMKGACENEVVIGADFIQATVVKVLVVN
jgi:hypothetical protein